MNEIFDQEQDDEIIRYLRDQLDAEDKARFEVRMLEEPELLERVQMLEALVHQLKADPAALLAEKPAAISQVLPFSSWIRQPLSLAATVLAGIAVVLGIYRGPADGTQSLASPVGSVILLEDNRSGAATQAGGAAPYLLQIDAGLDAQAAMFSIVIRAADSQQVILEEAELGADANGWIRLLIQDLPSGEYTVDVSTAGAEAAPQMRSYRFRIGNR